MAYRGNGLNDIYDNDLEVKKRLITKDGTIYATPVNNLDIVNKAYVDSNIPSLPLSHTSLAQITNVGTNTHAVIDTHIASQAIHFTLDQSIMGVQIHAADASVSRALLFDCVTWIGSVTPLYANNNDLWVDTT
jgi:hypothetical protein